MLAALIVIVIAYLLGSISSAVIVGRLLGTADPRTQGSGNPGATNMLRIGGKKAGALTLIGDMLKGLIAVLIARAIGAGADVQALAAGAAFLGHLFPVFFGFRGGKGVATALGALLGLQWGVGLLVIATWLAMAALFRYSSLAALIAAAMAPIYMWWLKPEPAVIAAAIVMSVLLYWRHRSNIRNLLAGKEGRIRLGARN
ncbi:MAG TPA: glycerol-3-phosphate 1-O-acyltransferase PlsY [Gammaproteobacteria bacterium]